MLAGGQGTRLRPLTVTIPKPMLPAAGVPFLTHQLVRAREAGVDHVVLATAYKAEVFEEHFGDGSVLALEIEYVTEADPLGTGGGIRNVLGRLRGGADDPVVVLNGDVLSGHDIGAQVALHRQRGAVASLHLVRVSDARAFGCVPTDADGWVTAFHEKDPDPVTDQINAGCYVFNRSVIEGIPVGRPVSVERETFPLLLEAGAPVLGVVDSAYWLDLGTPEAFVRGSCDLVRGVAPSSALPGPTGEALVLPGARVAPDAVVTGGTTVGEGATVAAGATVDGSVLLPGCRVDPGALLRGSVVGRDATVGAGSVLDGAVIGDGARIGARNELLAGVRVWPGVELPDVAVRFSSDA